jgi:hypothetical protein
MQNPWINLPTEPPFVLECDRTDVELFNERVRSKNRRLLVNDMMPEPFIGNPKAPVLLLSNNPGAGKGRVRRACGLFYERIRANLRQEESAYPFHYLAPDLDEADPNRKWWERRVKHLIDYANATPSGTRPRRRVTESRQETHRRFAREVVARSLLNVVFFPYPSVKFGDDVPRLASQCYGFSLVQEAMRRGAFIIFMRSARRWLKEIPELERYEQKCQVDNVQNPTVSPNNLIAFQDVVAAIAASVDRPGEPRVPI